MSTSAERAPAAGPARLAGVTWGEVALAALVISVASGVALAVPYDVGRPLESVALLLLANPAGAWCRNVHYWASQVLLVATIVHVWDTLRRSTQLRLRPGAWLRLVLTVPGVALLAWSGFVLKGDAEALQALRVVATTTASVPVVGSTLAGLLFGPDAESLTVVYTLHVATLTLAAWVVTVEHGRLVWPSWRAVWLVALPAAVAGSVLAPALHDGLHPVVKGPWYFIGLQEAFHWSPWPMLVVTATALPVLLIAVLRWARPSASRWANWSLVTLMAFYLGLTLAGWLFRGADWTWTSDPREQPAPVTWSPLWRSLSIDAARLRATPIPTVMGRPEGCLFCHEGVRGLSTSHDPSTIGCASCHLGNVFSLDATGAHAGMRVVPGNLADAARTCGGSCHGPLVTRVEASLMTTLAGIVSVNRAVWGEAPGEAPAHVARLGHSPADAHLRQLCASCHLGAVKTEPAPVRETSRGGGCTACHVTYSEEARDALARYLEARAAGQADSAPAIHPDVALPRDGSACFGCHSRSGRISLSYEGWHEVDTPPAAGVETRALEDGRTLVKVVADAHAAKGMTCVDCHTAREVMGDGQRRSRSLEAPMVACEDCHHAGGLLAVEEAHADESSRRVALLRGRPHGDRPLVATATGDVLPGAFLTTDGRGALARTSDGGRLELRPPAIACRDEAHRRLACITCHTAWAPRCPTCHTRFDPGGEGYDLLDGRDVRGAWIEQGGGFVAVPPTLAVRTLETPMGRRDAIEPAVPGMIATLDAALAPRGPGGEAATSRSRRVFRRLYARTFSHTVTRKGRSCRYCHNDPVALGYGEGTLRYDVNPESRGRWRFTPAHPPSAHDALPADAWIGFLATRDDMVSSRPNVRPLTVDEQKRTLLVGACLTCHAEDSGVMRQSLRDFEAVLRGVTPRCVVPRW